MSIYVDTSFLVSVYVNDRHSTDARQRMTTHPTIWLTPFHLAEWAHAVAQHVFLQKMSSAEAQQFYGQMDEDRTAGVWVATELPTRTFEVCAELARRYGPRLGIRTLDSLHVAAALELEATRFWTFDERQAKLAKAVGLKTA